MANVTAGSMLNQRVYSRQNRTAGSQKNGGGVKPNVLSEARVQLANRNNFGARTSYAALSNNLNGRKEVIYLGENQGGCCGSSGSSTMQDVLAFVGALPSILNPALSIINAAKTSGVKGTGNAQKATQQSGMERLNKQGGVQTFGQDNYSIGSQGLSTTLALVDIDYKDGATDFLSQMKKADTSQELYQAIQGAKAYKGQLDNRISTMQGQVQGWQNQLETLKGEAEGSVAKAEAQVDADKDAAKKAAGELKQAECQVDSARTGYASAKEALAQKDDGFKKASEEEAQLTKDYDGACKKTAEARKNTSAAKTALTNAETAYQNAQVNTQQAQANLDALESQRGSGDAAGTAALEAQITQAKAALETAKQAEAKALEAKNDANTKLEQAQKQEQSAVENENQVKANLQTKRNDLKALAKDLAKANKITQDQADLLDNRTTSLERAEGNLSDLETKFDSANDKLQLAEQNLAELEAQKDALEMKLSDFNEMKKGSEKLSDLSSYETKLEKMMQKENKKMEDLQGKLDDKNADSNNSDLSAKQRARAEKGEARITDNLAGWQDRTASDDIARDQKATGGKAWKPGASSSSADNGAGIVTGTAEGLGFDTPKSSADILKELNSLSHPGDSATINGKQVVRGLKFDSYTVNGMPMDREQVLKFLET